MARAGVTLDSVNRAREALVARGESISIDSIRIELGNTGSKSTIHKHLKALAQNEAANAARPSLSDELAHLITGVAQRLESEANEARDALQAAFDDAGAQWDSQRREFEDALARLEQDCTSQQEHIATLEADNTQIKNTLRDADGRTKQLEKDIVSREKEITLLSQHNASLEAKHKDARDSLAHYRESVKQQRDEEQVRFENDVARLEQALREVKLSLTEKVLTITSLNSSVDKVKGENKQLNITIDIIKKSQLANEKEVKALSIENSTLKERLKVLEQEKVGLESDKLALVTKLSDVQNNCESLIVEKHLLLGQVDTQKGLIDQWIKDNQLNT